MRTILTSIVAAVISVCAAAADPHDYYATIFGVHGTGSGFMLAPGTLATNAHVVAGQVPGDRVQLVAAGRSATAEIVAISPNLDLALLAVPADLLPVVPQGTVRLGRNTALTAVGAGDTASGRVVAPRYRLEPYGLGMTARLRGVRQGFSGGPVFDGNGLLAGMVSAIYLRRADLAFLISADSIHAESCRLMRSLCVR